MFKYYDSKEGTIFYGTIIRDVVIALVALVLIFGSFGTIPQQHTGIRTQFDSVIGTVDSGLYFKLPFIQKVTPISTQTQVVSFEGANTLGAASKDLQTVNLAVVLNYSIIDSKVTEVYSKYRTESAHQSAVIEPILRDAMKATSAKYTAEELITKRATFVSEAEKTLVEQLQTKANLVAFERVNVVNIDFSKSFNSAIEAKVTAEQDALAAKNKLEQVKFEADQRVAQAQAEAEAIKIQAQAITQQGGKDYVNLKWIEAWKEGGAKVPNYIVGDGSSFLFNLNGN